MRNYKELSSIHITETTALQGLNKIKVNKSSGPDNIHLRVLHEISENITIPITNIIKSFLKCQDFVYVIDYQSTMWKIKHYLRHEIMYMKIKYYNNMWH